METIQTKIQDVLIIKPKVFEDERGFFFESFNEKKFNEIIRKKVQFVQDNHSRSCRNVLRGLHYQVKYPQGKLIRVVMGEIYDVAVDMRQGSETFGKWIGEYISSENKRQLWIPEGFAHGFVVTSEYAEVLYKTTDYWHPEYERSILWNDKNLNIKWPLNEKPELSEKDMKALSFKESEAI